MQTPHGDSSAFAKVRKASTSYGKGEHDHGRRYCILHGSPVGCGAEDQHAFGSDGIISFKAPWEGLCPHCESLLTSPFPSTQSAGNYYLSTTLQLSGVKGILQKFSTLCLPVLRMKRRNVKQIRKTCLNSVAKESFLNSLLP